MSKWIAVAALVVVVLIGLFVSKARRLDALHRRGNGAYALLCQRLEERWELAGKVARLYPHAPQVPQRACDFPTQTNESQLSRWITAARPLLEQNESNQAQPATALLQKLDDNALELQVARRFYNNEVATIRRLRLNWAVRLFHLAGRAPMPESFDMDDGE
ncbi:hypothetical protein [Gleimia hominis]|uniref:hypothetical protein n=1 Tax=Gleimia hominis TaxID=595468 RepID=UPI000C7FB931|nr:hypothetical protein [Gleimia hominis]WIK65121.1 hypothetical protein CJ187_003470 [Gleimia hominis]